jgi:RNA polymerase sigma-70 factor, ECF subfamily
MTFPSDSDLVQAARAGDTRALEQLIIRYQSLLWRYARRMCGLDAEAEDVLQDTLLAAVRGFPQFRGDASVRTWLFSILRHACFRVHRRRGPDGRRPPANAAAASDALAATDAPGPEQQASSRQLPSSPVTVWKR